MGGDFCTHLTNDLHPEYVKEPLHVLSKINPVRL